MKNYPVYYDWWLQDGRNVHWFKGSFSQQLSRRLGELNLATNVTETPESIETAFLSYLKACEKDVQSVWLLSLPISRRLSLRNLER